MTPFTLYPAIDLRHGRVVRLTEGLDETTKAYHDDPLQAAASIRASGATHLHVVDLDAAFGESPQRTLIAGIVRSFPGGEVQVGGGVRGDADVEELVAAGVGRVIVGSAAVERPAWVASLVARLGPDALVVGLDARDGVVRTHGWKESGGRSLREVAHEMAACGVREVIYTNIANDGRLSGPDIQGSLALARESGLSVVVSGGVGCLDDVRRVALHACDGLSGLIIGKALYEGRLTLAEAMEVSRAEA